MTDPSKLTTLDLIDALLRNHPQPAPMAFMINRFRALAADDAAALESLREAVRRSERAELAALADVDDLRAEVERLKAEAGENEIALAAAVVIIERAHAAMGVPYCFHCGSDTPSHDPAHPHWRDCPKHPARAEIEALKVDVKLAWADCVEGAKDCHACARCYDALRAEVEALKKERDDLAEHKAGTQAQWKLAYDSPCSGCGGTRNHTHNGQVQDYCVVCAQKRDAAEARAAKAEQERDEWKDKADIAESALRWIDSSITVNATYGRSEALTHPTVTLVTGHTRRLVERALAAEARLRVLEEANTLRAGTLKKVAALSYKWRCCGMSIDEAPVEGDESAKVYYEVAAELDRTLAQSPQSSSPKEKL